jgi:hypothetical protein
MGEIIVHSNRKGVSLGWTPEEGEAEEVTVYATGEDGDVHNKLPQPNTGEAGVFYPADFTGTSDIEVRDGDGNVLHGPTTISVP